MKKTVFAILLILTVVFTFSTCSAPVPEAEKVEQVKLGVIETTGYKNKSYFHFFDENLNYLYKETNKYAALSEPFDSPIFEDGNLYTSCKGKYKKFFGDTEDFVLKYNLETGNYTALANNKNLIGHTAVSDGRVYTCFANTITGNPKTGQGQVAAGFNAMLSCVTFLDDELYVVASGSSGNQTLPTSASQPQRQVNSGSDSGNESIQLMKMSPDTLEVLERYDITQYGLPCKLFRYNDKIYISNQYTDDTTGTPSTMLTVFDYETKTFSQIDTGEASPNNLFVMNDLLFISHFSPVTNIGNKISVYNLKTNEIKTYEMGDIVKQIATDGTYIYMLGESTVYKYEYTEDGFSKLTSRGIEVDESQTYFYISSFFVCD